METVSNIAVATAEVAAIGDLEFEIPKRGNGRRMGNSISLDWSFRWGDKIFRETVLNELLVFFSYRDAFTLRAFQEKLISLFAQFIEFVIFNIIKVGFFKPLQGTVGGNCEELIFVGHLQSLLE
jgi:hypothetical protein